MPAKLFAAIMACLILLPGAVAANNHTLEIPITNWHWINTFTAYDPTGKAPLFRSWGSLQGVVKFTVHNGQFEVTIGEAKDGTDTFVKGRIRGHEVTAIAGRVQTDLPPRRYRGSFDEDFGAKRISLTSPDGNFIGFITQAPPGSEAHD